MAKNKKIVRYRKPLNINVGMIIFAMIFVYLSFSVYTYLRRDHVQFYEVVEGSIVNNKEYNGILFRDETVENAPQTGYVNYYVREGKRAGAGARVYSLDETGELGKFLEENQSSGVSLSAENLADLKKQLKLGYGVEVTGVTNGKMKDAGVRKGFIILKVNNIPMKTVEDLEKVMKEAAKTQEQVLFITGMFPSGKRGSYAVSVAQD